MSSNSPGRTLRALVDETGIIQVPGAPSALFGKLIEQMGYPAAYLSGAALSAGVLGLPDVGLVTLTELAQAARYLCQSVAIPIIADADTGFGESVAVERTVFELERAGVGAIQIEDQESPKRCGHLSGKRLVDPAVMSAKLRAAAAARENPDLVLIARTDARGVTSLDDAIDRAQRYLDAGADWIFPEALATEDEFEQFAEKVQAPLVANMTEFGKSPLLSADRLAELGFRVALYPVTLLRVAMKASEAALALLASEGIQTELLDLMQTREELYELLGYQDFEARDRQYFGHPPKKPD